MSSLPLLIAADADDVSRVLLEAGEKGILGGEQTDCRRGSEHRKGDDGEKAGHDKPERFHLQGTETHLEGMAQGELGLDDFKITLGRRNPGAVGIDEFFPVSALVDLGCLHQGIIDMAVTADEDVSVSLLQGLVEDVEVRGCQKAVLVKLDEVVTEDGDTFLGFFRLDKGLGDVGDDLSIPEFDDTVAEMFGKVPVMGDDDDKLVLGKLLQGLEDLFSGIGIQGSRRFVSEDDLGVLDQGPGDGNPLLLTTGKFIGFSLLHPASLQVDFLQDLFNLFIRCLLMLKLKGKGDVLLDGEVA